jgi:hypothetical protein
MYLFFAQSLTLLDSLKLMLGHITYTRSSDMPLDQAFVPSLLSLLTVSIFLLPDRTRELSLRFHLLSPGCTCSFSTCADSSFVTYPFPALESSLSEYRDSQLLSDLSAVAELNVASWATDVLLPVRILLTALYLGPVGPSVLEIDASSMMGGLAKDKFFWRQRSQGARLAMLRCWQSVGVLTLTHTPSSMRAVVLYKAPVPAASFLRCSRGSVDSGGRCARLECGPCLKNRPAAPTRVPWNLLVFASPAWRSGGA